MSETALSDQVSQMVSENQHLRVKGDNDDRRIALLIEQYDTLAASVKATHDRHEQEMHDMRTERDQAVRQFKTIEALLLQSSTIIMQALRARNGDDVPQPVPHKPLAITDHRLLPPLTESTSGFESDIGDIVTQTAVRSGINMMMRGRIHKRMYAVSEEGVGLIAGTLSYSRRAAIEHFLGKDFHHDWEMFKRTGYRTVMAQIKIIHRSKKCP